LQCGNGSKNLDTSGFSAPSKSKTANVQKPNQLDFFAWPYIAGHSGRLYKINVLLNLPEPLMKGGKINEKEFETAFAIGR